jgi:sarcosine oxidase
LFRSCLYTLTPDRDFVLDAVPGRPDVLVALGSAHAYKFASVIGRIMVELGIDGRTPSAGAIEAFTMDRPALDGSAEPATFVV